MIVSASRRANRFPILRDFIMCRNGMRNLCILIVNDILRMKNILYTKYLYKG